jgi:glycosyltransferase involved in cell wall biosynthesis
VEEIPEEQRLYTHLRQILTNQYLSSFTESLHNLFLMSNHQPRLSIGLPVYNGEKFIKEAIDSLLAQTFEDFELIISDNASTDKTEEICRAYAAQDKRIRYYRNQKNIGCSPNFNRVFELSSGEYFKWAAHDDLHAGDFLMKCVEILDQDPTIILCHSKVYFIDEYGKFLQKYEIQLQTDSPKPRKRFQELLTKHLCYQCYGVIRASALKKTPLMGSYGAADAIFLLRLGLLGRFYEIPEYLFFARNHAQQSLSMFFPDYMSLTHNNPQYSLNLLPDFYAYAVWFDSANEGKVLFPHWRIFWEYFISIWQVNLSFYERICCYLSLLKQFKGTEYLLLKDVLRVAQINPLWQNWQSSVPKQIIQS